MKHTCDECRIECNEVIWNMNQARVLCKKCYIQSVMDRLVDVSYDGDVYSAWSEGYISCLADNHVITKDEFNQLIDWMQSVNS